MDTLKVRQILSEQLKDKQKDYILNSLHKYSGEIEIKVILNPEEYFTNLILHQCKFDSDDLEDDDYEYLYLDTQATCLIGDTKFYKFYDDYLDSNLYVNMNDYINEHGEIEQSMYPCDFNKTQVSLIQYFYKTNKGENSESEILIYKP